MWILPPEHNVSIFTDGSCSRNKGGWAASIFYANDTIYISGNENNTTNNRMELFAAVRALESLPVACTVHLYSDSQYVVRGIKLGLQKWMRSDWRTSIGTEVINRDLWERMAYLTLMHLVIPHWVKGHSNHPKNEAVDSLAQYIRSCPI